MRKIQISGGFLKRLNFFVSIVLFWNRLEFYLGKKNWKPRRVLSWSDTGQLETNRKHPRLNKLSVPNSRRFTPICETWRINIRNQQKLDAVSTMMRMLFLALSFYYINIQEKQVINNILLPLFVACS